MTIRACDRIKFRKFCRWGNELMKVRPGLDLVYRSPEKLAELHDGDLTLAVSAPVGLRATLACPS
jgi:hypothetical protein